MGWAFHGWRQAVGVLPLPESPQGLSHPITANGIPLELATSGLQAADPDIPLRTDFFLCLPLLLAKQVCSATLGCLMH